MKRKQIIDSLPTFNPDNIIGWAKQTENALMAMGNSDNEILARKLFRPILGVWMDKDLEFIGPWKPFNNAELAWKESTKVFIEGE